MASRNLFNVITILLNKFRMRSFVSDDHHNVIEPGNPILLPLETILDSVKVMLTLFFSGASRILIGFRLISGSRRKGRCQPDFLKIKCEILFQVKNYIFKYELVFICLFFYLKIKLISVKRHNYRLFFYKCIKLWIDFL